MAKAIVLVVPWKTSSQQIPNVDTFVVGTSGYTSCVWGHSHGMKYVVSSKRYGCFTSLVTSDENYHSGPCESLAAFGIQHRHCTRWHWHCTPRHRREAPSPFSFTLQTLTLRHSKHITKDNPIIHGAAAFSISARLIYLFSGPTILPLLGLPRQRESRRGQVIESWEHGRKLGTWRSLFERAVVSALVVYLWHGY